MEMMVPILFCNTAKQNGEGRLPVPVRLQNLFTLE